MKIAVIGWGSLIWDKRELDISEDWVIGGGPTLRLEFSRVSKDCRLTLVIDHADGAEVQTRYAVSSFQDLDAAIENLRLREGAVSSNPIGYVNLTDRTSRARNTTEIDLIGTWAREAGVEAVIWSDFRPNFAEETGWEFSVDNAIKYLLNLPKSARARAFEYVRYAPLEVHTPLRQRLADWKLV